MDQQTREWTVHDETHIMSEDALARLRMRHESDETVKRPLWEFSTAERRAVLHERARRWGVPNGEDDFDPEYH
jgi:hypothetical protein